MSYGFYLPFPPSVNTAYASKIRNGKIVRFISKRYEVWCKLALQELQAQKVVKGIADNVRLTLGLIRPDLRKRDAANYEKTVTDTIVKYGVLNDDSQIIDNRQMWIPRGDIPEHFGCVVLIENAGE